MRRKKARCARGAHPLVKKDCKEGSSDEDLGNHLLKPRVENAKQKKKTCQRPNSPDHFLANRARSFSMPIGRGEANQKRRLKGGGGKKIEKQHQKRAGVQRGRGVRMQRKNCRAKKRRKDPFPLFGEGGSSRGRKRLPVREGPRSFSLVILVKSLSCFKGVPLESFF